MKYSFVFLLFALLIASCSSPDMQEEGERKSYIGEETLSATFDSLAALYASEDPVRIRRGLEQLAAFWQSEDGSASDYSDFALRHYTPAGPRLELLRQRFAEKYEVLLGSFNYISLKLKEPVHLDVGELQASDHIFSAYSPASHFEEDMFENKLALISLLNFPFFSLEEKDALAAQWDRSHWAEARLGEVFTTRLPSALRQEQMNVTAAADAYISDYNIYLGNLRDASGEALFPAELRLISHWGLRDEIKSQYANPGGLAQQRMIYQVMERIVTQEIPKEVINQQEVRWDPFSNQISKGEEMLAGTPEGHQRYQYILDFYETQKAQDAWHPYFPTYIDRKFGQEMEMSFEEVETLFTTLLSSEEVRKTALLIRERLGRDLEPFDIWYDGFKQRSSIPEEELSSLTRRKYPDPASFEADLPRMLTDLGFEVMEAARIASHITVDPSRGAGHAWGAAMRGEKAHLRTRIGADGMDYKGYNIAVHEFGHNVEQTLSLQDIDYYMLNGVPNTAFTEALAFIFQKRDLSLLGYTSEDTRAAEWAVLDQLWSNYEIMGVALVDMYLWDWLYTQENVTAEALKEAALRIAREVWNTYYAPVFGITDSPILAVYSHMVKYPLYLPAYPLGRLIQFQLEQHLENEDFAAELTRIYRLGRLTPKQWMKEATGESLSVQPLLRAAAAALNSMEKES